MENASRRYNSEKVKQMIERQKTKYGWALGCRIDGGQAEYVRVPFADQGLNKIPDGVTDRQALLVGDVLATGYWAARISEISEQDTVLIIGIGPPVSVPCFR